MGAISGYAPGGIESPVLEFNQAAPVHHVDQELLQLTRPDPVANWVMRILHEAQQYRKTYDTQWEYYYQLYRSQHYPTRKINRGAGTWQAKLAINYIFSIIESIISTMTDNKPKINVVPTSPEQQFYASNLQEALDSIWYRRKAHPKLQDALKNAMIYGTGYLKFWWDPDCEGGKGDVEIGVPDPFSIFPEPSATSFHDAEHVLEVRETSVDYIRRHYPKNGGRVRADAATDSGMKYKRENGMSPGAMGNFLSVPLVSPIDDNPLRIDQTDFSSPPYKSGQPAGKKVTLIECWVRDYSTKKVQTTVMTVDPMTGMQIPILQEYEEPMYPNGRIIHVANGVVLQDKPAPYWLWPYVRVVDNSLPGEFFGQGEPEILHPLQHELNKARNQIINHRVLMGNAIWIVDKDSGVDRDQITNEPGFILYKYRGSEVRRESPPQLPSWQVQMVEMTIRDMREISGIGAATSGVVPRGIRSGSGFEAAQEIANSRIRLKVRNLESALEDAGRIMVSLIQQFYTVPRMIRVLGNAGEVAFVPFDGTHVRGDWDLRVGAGSTLPVSRAVQAQNAIQLFQLGVIDQRAVLEHTDFPDAEDIINRMGGPLAPEPRVMYEGWPGQPRKDRESPSSYSLSVRSMPVPAMPPGPPGGTMPGMPAGGTMPTPEMMAAMQQMMGGQ